MSMGMGLLPDWLRYVWVVAFAGIVAVHVGHAWARGDQRRVWHGAHALACITRLLGDTGRWQGTLALPSSGARAAAGASPVALAGRASLGLRASLAVMATGMAYMFVAMQAGT